MMKKTHIMLQGSGSYPLNFKALIEHAHALGEQSIQWSIICTTGHHVKTFEELLGKDAVLYLHSDIRRYMQMPDLLNHLSDYSGNIYADIETEKRSTKHKNALRQLKTAAAMYLSMKDFMQRRQPTEILFGLIESMDGMIMLSLGKELQIPALVPTHSRHLAETFFATDQFGTLPSCSSPSSENKKRAKQLLNQFRQGQTNAVGIPPEVSNSPDEKYSFTHPHLLQRTINFVQYMINEPEMRELRPLRANIFTNLPRFMDAYRNFKAWRNKNIYDIGTINELPKRFAYYPIQFTPEASINTPDPYFVDQLRAIDAIRFAIPSDMFLVIKEHPACLRVRPPNFLKSLQKKAGVMLARYDIPSDQLIDRADITLSVTGTATLEAFLKGKPSLTLGHSFFAEFLGGPTGVDSLQDRIRKSISRPPSDEKILDAIARVYEASGPFLISSPFDTASPAAKYVLNKTNIDYFYRHLKREIGHADPVMNERSLTSEAV